MFSIVHLFLNLLFQPVCKVHTWPEDSMDVSEDSGLSIYNSSFKQKCQSERRQLVTSRDKETTAHGIGQYTLSTAGT